MQKSRIKDRKVLEYSNQLKKLGIRHKIVKHPVLKTADEVEGYLGLTLADGVATLIMKADGECVAIVRRDDCRLDRGKIRRGLKIKELRMATPEEFVQQTGLPVGAARVYNPALETFLDERLFEKEYLTGGTGSFTCSFRYRSEDLKKIPGSRVVDVTTVSMETGESKFTSRKRVLSGRKSGSRKFREFFKGRVAVFIDAANIAKSAEDFGCRVSYRRLKRFFSTNCKLVYIRFYSVAFGNENHQAFLNFLSHRGYHLVTKPLKIIKNHKGKEIKKANFDVEISVEVMERIADFDTLVLFSGDSDFEYLLRKLRLKGKKLIVFSTKYHIAKELIASCDKYFDLRKFKEDFLREK